MSSNKTEITACLLANMETNLDSDLALRGFTRRNRSLIYTRKLTGAIQKIDVGIQIRPQERIDSAAAIYPWLSVGIDSVEKLTLEMAKGDQSLLSNLSGVTLQQPIELTSAKAARARWYVVELFSVAEIVGEIKLFLQEWTIPFLDMYSTPEGICSAYDGRDTRVINGLEQTLRVAAAMVLCGRVVDALNVMERHFGKPGLRKHYQKVFDFLAAKLGHTERQQNSDVKV